MRKAFPLILLLCLLLSISISPAMAQEEEPYYEDFEGDLAGWDLDNDWQIILQDGNRVLQGEGSSWAVLHREFSGDFRLRFQIKVISGPIHVITHLTDEGRYFSGINLGDLYLSKQYWPDTFQNGLVGSPSPVTDPAWADIELISLGDSLKFSLNGEQMWYFEDPEKFEMGEIGFETLGESVGSGG